MAADTPTPDPVGEARKAHRFDADDIAWIRGAA